MLKFGLVFSSVSYTPEGLAGVSDPLVALHDIRPDQMRLAEILLVSCQAEDSCIRLESTVRSHD